MLTQPWGQLQEPALGAEGVLLVQLPGPVSALPSQGRGPSCGAAGQDGGCSRPGPARTGLLLPVLGYRRPLRLCGVVQLAGRKTQAGGHQDRTGGVKEAW